MKRTERRGASGSNGARKPAPPPEARKNPGFGKGSTMETAKRQVDQRRQMKMDAAGKDLAGLPSPGKGLVEISVVIPGGRLLPRELQENPGCLDGIRQEFQVWITNVEPQIIIIHGDSMPQLKGALRAIHDTLHNLRLASKSSSTRFTVQKPCRSTFTAPIRAVFGLRPVMLLPLNTRGQPRDFSRAVAALTTNISTELSDNLDALTCRGEDLRMRIKFGHLAILREGLEEKLTLDEFAKEFRISSHKGLTKLETWFPNPRLASLICQHLVDPSKGPAICFDRKSVRSSYSLAVTVDKSDILLDAFVTPHLTELTPVGASRPGVSPCFNCTIAAPDMTYDWSLHVDYTRRSCEMPKDIADLMKEISLRVSASADLEFSPISLAVAEATTWQSRVSKTKLKTTKTIPIKDTPYVVEVTVMQEWQGLRPPQRAVEAAWQIEIYGVHWDEAMNQIKPGERKKDWGANMENIWPGTEPQQRAASFREFILAVLEVQAALADMDITEI